MNNLIYKTKLSLIGIFITGLTALLIFFVLITNTIDLITVVSCLLLLASVLFPNFVASIVIEFYDDFLIIKFPLLSFYKNHKFCYSNIKSIEYRYKIREPNSLEIILKDESKKTFWCRFRSFSNDKKKIGEIFNDKNVAFRYRRFGKVRGYNETEWRRIKNTVAQHGV